MSGARQGRGTGMGPRWGKKGRGFAMQQAWPAERALAGSQQLAVRTLLYCSLMTSAAAMYQATPAGWAGARGMRSRLEQGAAAQSVRCSTQVGISLCQA